MSENDTKENNEEKGTKVVVKGNSLSVIAEQMVSMSNSLRTLKNIALFGFWVAVIMFIITLFSAK